MSTQSQVISMAVKPVKPFVAVDWGTSSLRLWHVESSGEVVASRAGSEGMSTLQRSDYNTVLERYLADLEVAVDCPVVICGMAGAAQGWYDAAYMPVSNSLFDLGQHVIRVPGIERKVFILPGLMQSEPANVMRGEETQLSGLLVTESGFTGVVCLPGTHTKWVVLNTGSIQRFTTCMTGELFALLSKQSVLKHSVDTCDWDSEAFITAVTDSMDAPASIAESLFALRASTLLHNQAPAISRARLSGLLIGFELEAMRNYWQGSRVALLGDSTLCEHYTRALMQRDAQVQCLDSQSLTLDGLVHAFNQIEAA